MKAKALLGLGAVVAAAAFFLAAFEHVAAAGILGLVTILLLYGSDRAATREHNENIN
jgi:hypothetical protein|nr:MAG TPA: hypothetical protein [Caudoviricetes sp.]